MDMPRPVPCILLTVEVRSRSKGLKIFSAGVGAAATGISALGTAAVKGYAEYEQLAGGVETLFDNTENLERYKNTLTNM